MNETRQVEAARRFEPTEHYAEWRERCPLHQEAGHDPPFFVISRFDDVVDVLKQPDLWSNNEGPGVQFLERGVLGSCDEPDHGRHRRVLRDAFIPAVINRQEPELRAIADELIDAFIAEGACDFVESFAAPFPALAIATLLGIHADDHDEFGRWSNDAVAALTGGDLASYIHAKGVLEDYVEAGCDERATRLAAGGEIPDDVLSRLARARSDGTISAQEARHLGYQLLVAGHETTTSLLGMMLYRMLERPTLMAALRGDESLIPTAVEEALRFDSPVHGLFRTNGEECTVHGQTIEPRTKLQVAYAAANRDPRQFPQPDEFRLDRERRESARHVAFGWGIHYCIGAPLARLETRIAFEQLLRRLDRIELDGEPVRNDSFVLHGLTHLPIRFGERDVSILDQFRLDGQVAVVTGSGQGIGRAIAWAFADAGCDVVVNARRAGDLEHTAHEIEARGCRALIVEHDIRDYSEDLADQALAEFAANTISSPAGERSAAINTAPKMQRSRDGTRSDQRRLRRLVRGCLDVRPRRQPRAGAPRGTDRVHVHVDHECG